MVGVTRGMVALRINATSTALTHTIRCVNVCNEQL